MKIIRGIKEMQETARRLKKKNKSIGFVPTLGALHGGHLSLIRQARKESDVVIVSIFVNPLQFGPREDFKKYPRNLGRDARLCKISGADIVFYPGAQAMYPQQYRTYVNVEALSDVLCGKSRPGHFQGVASVVSKLFNITQPDIAYFGAKDAQQAIIIKRMTQDLNMPIKVKVMPIVREKSGLALSSRNSYLSPGEKKDALVLYQCLKLTKDLVKQGINDSPKIIQRLKELIRKQKTARIDYISIVDMENLNPKNKISGNCLLAMAVRFGRTRLIDNAIIKA